MPRARIIKPGFFKSDQLGSLSPVHRILFAGLWCWADREGRLEDRPTRLKAEVLPYDTADADAMLSDLAGVGLIERYEADGQRFIQISTFSKHQKVHPKELASVLPSKTGALPRVRKIRSKRAETGIASAGTEADPTGTEANLVGTANDPAGTGEDLAGNGSDPARTNIPFPSLPSSPSLPSLEKHVAAPRPPAEPAAPKAAEKVYVYWQDKLKKPDLPMGREVWSIIGARLRDGATVEQLLQVVDGAAIDAERWPERAAQDGIPFLFGSMSQVAKFVDLAVKGAPKPKVDVRRGVQRAEDQGWDDAPHAKAEDFQ